MKELEAQYKKSVKHRNKARIKELMDKTAKRREWIEEKKPMICEVLEKFPPLASSQGVS